MKTFKFFLLVSVMTLIFSVNVFSQVLFKATITNQNAVIADPTYGNCVYFDIYLQQDAGSSGPVYLADADFKFTFNNANFTGATIEYIDESNELWNSSGASTIYYNAGILPTFLAPNYLIVNVAPPGFTTQTQFNSRVAKIDATPNKHKLGHFVVYTVSNTSGNFGLTWLTGVGGTVVVSYDPVSPWNSGGISGTLEVITDIPLPVQLASFTGNVENKRDVKLTWKTEFENNNAGFEVQRAEVGSQNLEFRKISFVSGKGTTNTPVEYRFEDKKLNTGKYNYRLKQIDNNGNYEYFTLNTVIEVGVPTKYDMSQNYPNPFNPTTKIDFDLPLDSRVSIILYDISGREIKTLVNDSRTAGYYTVQFSASDLSSGTYFYRIMTKSSGADFIMTKKMMLIK
jgi:hypothetical protein